VSRREFIVGLAGAAIAWPLAARAQQASRPWRVGLLVATSMRGASAPYFMSFKQQIRSLGYVEQQNLIFITREGEGNFEHLRALAREIVLEHPDVIVASTTPSIAAARSATTEIPIVMCPATDPLGSGFIKSFARPGTNVTGVTNMAADVTPKALELLRTLVPNAARIAVLMSENPVHPGQYQEALAASNVIGVTLIPIIAKWSNELEGLFPFLVQQNCDALLVLADALRLAIVELANRAKLPAIYQQSEFVKAGGLFSYGPNFSHIFGRAAIYVDKILKGAAPAELPVEQPTKFELLINLKTAESLGINVPLHLQQLADEVIE
jgi:putative ABC transport system substrate-binding protein